MDATNIQKERTGQGWPALLNKQTFFIFSLNILERVAHNAKYEDTATMQLSHKNPSPASPSLRSCGLHAGWEGCFNWCLK